MKASVPDLKILMHGIDLTDQKQVDALKAKYPGVGIGPYVQDRLMLKMVSGELSGTSEFQPMISKENANGK